MIGMRFSTISQLLTLPLPLLLLLAACGGGKKKVPKADRAALESPVAIALLQHVIEHCPHKAAVKGWNLTIGEAMEPPAEATVARLTLPAGVVYVPAQRMEVAQINGRRHIYDSASGASPLTVQISSLSPLENGRHEAVAAWAWMDQARRARYEITTGTSGSGYTIRELEEIPVMPVNTTATPATTAP